MRELRLSILVFVLSSLCVARTAIADCPVGRLASAPNECKSWEQSTDGKCCPNPDLKPAVRACLHAFAEHEHVPRALWLGSMKLNLANAYGTIAGDASSDVNSETPSEFDGGKYTGGAKLGYFGKPIARDIRIAKGDYETYCKISKKSHWRVFLWDALKLDLNGGYGSVIKDAEGDDNFTSEEDWSWQLGLSYELPLDRVFGEPLPQH